MKIFTKASVAAAIFAMAAAGADAAKVGFVVTPGMTDDDEIAAKAWATGQGYDMIEASDLATVSPETTPVLWVMVDRVGLAPGVGNLPFTASEIESLKEYSAAGGCLYLSNHATQLAAELGYTGEYGLPGVYGSGEGGSGNDVWTLNPVMGVMFGPGKEHEGEQGYYDRSGHAIYAGLEMTDPNGWGFNGLAMIGPGQREDHNSLWDLNPVGRGDEADVVANFEAKRNAKVLATWGHVQDHCVAALVEFNKTASLGPCIANGLAAYEWNQNSGVNPYQGNIEKLTSNIIGYLCDVATAGVTSVGTDATAERAYYTLQGVKVDKPVEGVCIVVENGKARKVMNGKY